MQIIKNQSIMKQQHTQTICFLHVAHSSCMQMFWHLQFLCSLYSCMSNTYPNLQIGLFIQCVYLKVVTCDAASNRMMDKTLLQVPFIVMTLGIYNAIIKWDIFFLSRIINLPCLKNSKPCNDNRKISKSVYIFLYLPTKI